MPAAGGGDATELVSTAATAAITLGFLVWQQAAASVVIDGIGRPLIDPALWASWLPVLVGVLVADLLLAVVSDVPGRWTWPFALVNAAIALGFALPVLWLIQAGQLLDPALVRELAEAGQGEGLRIVLTILSIGIAAVTAYEIGDGFRRARRSGNRPAAGARPATSGSNA